MNTLNVLSDEWQRRLLVRRRLRRWIGVWIVTGICCFAASAMMYAMQVRHRAQYYELQEKAHPIQMVSAQVRELRARLAVLEGRESLLGTLESASQPFQLLGIVSNCADTDVGNVNVTGFTVRTEATATNGNGSPVANASQKSSARAELIVTGIASDDFAITQFVSRLRNFDVFDQVVLHSSQGDSDEADRKFRIGCSFEK